MLRFMAVRAVIFDWGGTLTPWHGVDRGALWQQACAPHFPADQAGSVAAALLAAENGCWAQCESEHSSATLARIFAAAGVEGHEEFIETYFGLWEPHTYTDPDVAPLLRLLRERSIKVGVLSNTVWPRALHERVFRRDGVLELIDGAVYSSEIPWTKPHPEAFLAAMTWRPVSVRLVAKIPAVVAPTFPGASLPPGSPKVLPTGVASGVANGTPVH